MDRHQYGICNVLIKYNWICSPLRARHTHTKRVEAACSVVHEGANKPCNTPPPAMHFAHGVSWDACLPGVVARDHWITHSVMHNMLAMGCHCVANATHYWKHRQMKTGKGVGGEFFIVKLKTLEFFLILHGWLIIHSSLSLHMCGCTLHVSRFFIFLFQMFDFEICLFVFTEIYTFVCCSKSQRLQITQNMVINRYSAKRLGDRL